MEIKELRCPNPKCSYRRILGKYCKGNITATCSTDLEEIKDDDIAIIEIKCPTCKKYLTLFIR